MSNWILYPAELVEEIAEKYGYKTGEFLYLLAADELPENIKNELKSRNEDRRPDQP